MLEPLPASSSHECQNAPFGSLCFIGAYNYFLTLYSEPMTLLEFIFAFSVWLIFLLSESVDCNMGLQLILSDYLLYAYVFTFRLKPVIRFWFIVYMSNVYQAMEIIKRLPQETKKKLAGKGYFPQDGYILKYLPVPPNCLSVPVVSDGVSIMSSVRIW